MGLSVSKLPPLVHVQGLPLEDIDPPNGRIITIDRARWTANEMAEKRNRQQCYCALGWLAHEDGATFSQLKEEGIHWYRLPKAKVLVEGQDLFWTRATHNPGNVDEVSVILTINDSALDTLRRRLDHPLPEEMSEDEVLALKEELLRRVFARLNIRLRFDGERSNSPIRRSLT